MPLEGSPPPPGHYSAKVRDNRAALISLLTKKPLQLLLADLLMLPCTDGMKGGVFKAAGKQVGLQG